MSSEIKDLLGVLHEVNNERQCRVNVQYSRRECLEVVGKPASVGDAALEDNVCHIFCKIGVKVSDRGMQSCHRLKKHISLTIVKFSIRKKSL